MVLTSEST